ncbi:MAG TPA: acyltransferase [Candidatus Limnocylindrales bacterium]|nr:acyltransferase [Candidatus Limnocylindrales bacterium]
MYRFLPGPLLGLLLLMAITINTFVCFVPILFLAVIKFAIPNDRWRHWWTRPLVVVAEAWIHGNNFFQRLALPTRFEFRGLDDPRLRRDGRYLVASNHQTWTDVLLLQYLLIDHIPFLRFFIKSELIYFPLLGFAWWALDMPFMKRYSAAKLARHPELRGKDFESTRRACDRFRLGPISIMNFVEGTRFSPAKRDQYKSPHSHLLKPKAGGIAAVLDAFSGDLDTLVNVTIAYSRPNMDFRDWLTGKVERVIAEVTVETIPQDIRRGNYTDDTVYRERVQAWVRELWEHKNERLVALMNEMSEMQRPGIESPQEKIPRT